MQTCGIVLLQFSAACSKSTSVRIFQQRPPGLNDIYRCVSIIRLYGRNTSCLRCEDCGRMVDAEGIYLPPPSAAHSQQHTCSPFIPRPGNCVGVHVVSPITGRPVPMGDMYYQRMAAVCLSAEAFHRRSGRSLSLLCFYVCFIPAARLTHPRFSLGTLSARPDVANAMLSFLRLGGRATTLVLICR